MGHKNELEFRELDVSPGKTLVKKGHISGQNFAGDLKIKLDLYFQCFSFMYILVENEATFRKLTVWQDDIEPRMWVK